MQYKLLGKSGLRVSERSTILVNKVVLFFALNKYCLTSYSRLA